VVEQLPEHELVCGSEPAWERDEGKAVVEQQPPRASGCEVATSSRGRRLGVVEAPLPEKHQAPLPSAPNVEVFLEATLDILTPLTVALDGGAAVFPTTTAVDFLPKVRRRVACHRCMMLRRWACIWQHWGCLHHGWRAHR
jgi:hypothetical protein